MLVVIPARGGSKRIPNKALKELAGKPLIVWAIDRAKASGYPWIVATEDMEIAALAFKSGASIMKRDKSTAQDTSPDYSWARDLPRLYPEYSLFAILRITSPFLGVEHLELAKDELLSFGYSSVRCVTPCTQHPGKMWEQVYESGLEAQPVMEGEHYDGTPYHSAPTQTLPKVYIQTAGLEITRRDTLNHSLAGHHVGIHVIDGPAALDINTPDDWARAEEIAKTWTP